MQNFDALWQHHERIRCLGMPGVRRRRPECNGVIAFPGKIRLKPGEVVVSAVIGFRSKAHRNLVNKRAQSDPRSQRMVQEFMENPFTDSKRMLNGGFVTIVKV